MGLLFSCNRAGYLASCTGDGARPCDLALQPGVAKVAHRTGAGDADLQQLAGTHFNVAAARDIDLDLLSFELCARHASGTGDIQLHISGRASPQIQGKRPATTVW